MKKHLTEKGKEPEQSKAAMTQARDVPFKLGNGVLNRRITAQGTPTFSMP